MKPRKVVVMIKMTNKLHLGLLRDKGFWIDVLFDNCDEEVDVHQVQANVVKVGKGGKAR